MAITKPVMKQHANKCSALYLCSDNCKSTQLFKPMQTFQHSSGQSKHLTSSHILWLIYTHTIQWWFSILVILLRRVTLKTNIKCGYCVTFVTLSLSKSAVIVNKIQQKINTPIGSVLFGFYHTGKDEHCCLCKDKTIKQSLCSLDLQWLTDCWFVFLLLKYSASYT